MSRPMASVSHTPEPRDTVREHLEKSRALREPMKRAGDAVVYHLRRAAEIRRRAARNGR